jgi:hypothetical protein
MTTHGLVTVEEIAALMERAPTKWPDWTRRVTEKIAALVADRWAEREANVQALVAAAEEFLLGGEMCSACASGGEHPSTVKASCCRLRAALDALKGTT